jgi:hypothetical protein
LGLLLLGGGEEGGGGGGGGIVYAERYFKLLNAVLETYVDELPLAGRCMVYFRQDGALLHFASEVRNWSDEVIH